MKKTDIGVVAFIYAICVFFFAMTTKLKPAAQTYPLFIIVVLAALNTGYVVKMALGAKKNGVTSGAEDFESFLPKQFFTILAFAVGYLILMYFLGFYISTVTFMVACLIFLRVPKLHAILSVLIVVALVFFAFRVFLGVKLPAGYVFA